MPDRAAGRRAADGHRHQVRASDGVTLSYRVLGDEGADDLLLLHSLGTDGSLWDDCIPGLAGGYRLIVPDSRGHGASSPAPTQSAELWADDIDRILRDVGSTSVTPVGVSMGGIQAIAYAEAHPDQVRALVIADSFLVLSEQVRQTKVTDLAGDLDTVPMTRIAQDYLAATFTEPYPDGAARVAAAITAIDPGSYLAATSACFGVDITRQAARVTAPTLVLWGDRDDKTPRTLSEQIQATIPGAVLAVVPDAGHLSNVDNPDGFNRALHGFLIDR